MISSFLTYAVFFSHFVKLVDAHDTSVREHHGSSLEVKLAGRRVPYHAGRQTSRATALARRVHTNGRDLFHEFEQLTFGNTGITE